jgi:hypothetical protein
MVIFLLSGSSYLFTDSCIELKSNLVLLITSRHGQRRKHILHCCSPTIALLRICCLATGIVPLFLNRTDAQKQPYYIRLIRGRCIAMARHATILKWILKNWSMGYKNDSSGSD